MEETNCEAFETKKKSKRQTVLWFRIITIIIISCVYKFNNINWIPKESIKIICILFYFLDIFKINK